MVIGTPAHEKHYLLTAGSHLVSARTACEFFAFIGLHSTRLANLLELYTLDSKPVSPAPLLLCFGPTFGGPGFALTASA